MDLILHVKLPIQKYGQIGTYKKTFKILNRIIKVYKQNNKKFMSTQTLTIELLGLY